MHKIPDPPGYRETAAAMKAPKYGWAVLVPQTCSEKNEKPKQKIAIVSVIDWREAKRTMPYQWLNTHPRQPVAPDKTLALVEEMLTKKRKR
jgi:hypothetical protein